MLTTDKLQIRLIAFFYYTAKSQSSVRTPHRHVSIYEPDTLCNPDIREPLYKAQIECKKSRPGIPLVQPIVGICSSRKALQL